MFSFSQFDKDDLFQKYKRQTYLMAFPFGRSCLSFCIAVNTLLADVVFFIAMFMVVELVLLTLLIGEILIS